MSAADLLVSLGRHRDLLASAPGFFIWQVKSPLPIRIFEMPACLSSELYRAYECRGPLGLAPLCDFLHWLSNHLNLGGSHT